MPARTQEPAPDQSSAFRARSALVPIAMSLLALSVVVGNALIFGVVHEADEGAAAHLFQLLMTAQVPIVLWFIFRFVARRRRQAWAVLAAQAGAWLLACLAVYLWT